ncbi:hypothetical protein Tco_0093978, partial [Tanacetum coccineum]
MARETNRLWREVVTMVEERSLFLEELDSLPGRRVPEKMAEFLLETQRKDTERLLQLQILGRETELRAREKEHFIQKLKDGVLTTTTFTIIPSDISRLSWATCRWGNSSRATCHPGYVDGESSLGIR